MAAMSKWLKITFFCPHDITEPVADMVGILSGAGVNIRPVKDRDHDEISGYFGISTGEKKNLARESSEILHSVALELGRLFALYTLAPPELRTEILDDQDWATCWQKYFTPFEIVPGLVIKPSWEEYAPEKNQHVLEMDPGMAFGTGQHESTRLALFLIAASFAEKSRVPKTVLDVGTGTGILAMGAAVFGACNVTAIDNDPQSVEIAAANIRHNDLHGTIQVSGLSLAEIRGSFDLICANIIHDVLVAMAPDFRRLLAPGGHTVLAGILHGEQEKNILHVFSLHGLQPVQSEYDGEWTGILLMHAG
jgi:ribosomal protein L11 methyltransferase